MWAKQAWIVVFVVVRAAVLARLYDDLWRSCPGDGTVGAGRDDRPPVEVSPHAYVADVARRMRDEDIGAVVVTEDVHPRGLVTDRDLTVRILAQGGDVTGNRV